MEAAPTVSTEATAQADANANVIWRLGVGMIPYLRELMKIPAFSKLAVEKDDPDFPAPLLSDPLPVTLSGDAVPEFPPAETESADLQGAQAAFRLHPSATLGVSAPIASGSGGDDLTMRELPEGEELIIGQVFAPGVAPEKARSNYADPKRGLQLKATLKAADMDPERGAALTNAYMVEAMKPKDTMNPNTKRFYENVLITWSIIIHHACPSMADTMHWSSETVLRYAAYYLIRRVAETKGRHGHESVHAYTVVGWLSALSWLIARFCFDPKTNKRNGMTILSQGLYAHLEATVLDIIRTKGLRRHLPKRQFLYRVDVQRLIEAALDASTLFGRMVKLQLICAIILVFYTAARPGTLVGNNDEAREKYHYYMKLGDVSFQRVGRCRWIMTVRYYNFKGYGGAVSLDDEHVIHPPGKAHNSIFGCFWLIMYMFLRGAFDPKYKTILDIINSQDDMLEVVKEKRNEPFFLRATSGGRWLDTDEMKPPTGTSLVGMLSELGKKAGYTIMINFRMLRRGAADMIGIILGARIASMILAHKDAQSTFKLHYSAGAANVPVAAAVLGEMGRNEELVKNKITLSLAVQVQMHRGALEKEQKRLGDLDEPDSASTKEFTKEDCERLEAQERDEPLPDGGQPMIGSGPLHAIASAHTAWLEMLPTDHLSAAQNITLKAGLAEVESIAFQSVVVVKTRSLSVQLDAVEKLTYGEKQQVEKKAAKPKKDKNNENDQDEVPPLDIDDGPASFKARALLENQVKERLRLLKLARRRLRDQKARDRNLHKGAAFTTADRKEADAVVNAPSRIVLQAVTAVKASSASAASEAQDLSVDPDVIEKCIANVDNKTPGQVWQPDIVDDVDISRDMALSGELGTGLRKDINKTRAHIKAMADQQEAEEDALDPEKAEALDFKSQRDFAAASAAENHDEPEPEIFKSVTVEQVTEAIMLESLEPHYAQVEDRRLKNEQGGFTCDMCEPFYAHPYTIEVLQKNRVRVGHIWKTRLVLEEHQASFHSDLLRNMTPDMVRENDTRLYCPRPGCGHSATDFHQLARHIRWSWKPKYCRLTEEGNKWWEDRGIKPATRSKGQEDTSKSRKSSDASKSSKPSKGSKPSKVSKSRKPSSGEAASDGEATDDGDNEAGAEDNLPDDPLKVSHIEIMGQAALVQKDEHIDVQRVLQVYVNRLNAPGPSPDHVPFPDMPSVVFGGSDDEDGRDEVYTSLGLKGDD